MSHANARSNLIKVTNLRKLFVVPKRTVFDREERFVHAVDDVTFGKVFALSPIAVLASMLAYLFAQYIDIAIYHFWKGLTAGKHLWLRNNFSTFFSQTIDTLTVVSLVCIFLLE